MRYRVCIQRDGFRDLYVANANMDAEVTHLVDGARRYHNSLNADIAAGSWERTLNTLCINADVIVEEAP